VRSCYGYEMYALRQRPFVRERDQSREQHTPSPMESESSTRPRCGEWRTQTNPCVHFLHSVRPRHESSLTGYFRIEKSFWQAPPGACIRF
jgi:hypothetical protein